MLCELSGLGGRSAFCICVHPRLSAVLTSADGEIIRPAGAFLRGVIWKDQNCNRVGRKLTDDARHGDGLSLTLHAPMDSVPAMQSLLSAKPRSGLPRVQEAGLLAVILALGTVLAVLGR